MADINDGYTDIAPQNARASQRDITSTAIRSSNVQNGITIKNAHKTAIIDPKGLNSLNNFPTGVVDVASKNISSTSLADITGASLSITLVRSVKVMIGISSTITPPLTSGAGSYGAAIGVAIDGVDQTGGANFGYALNEATTQIELLPTLSSIRIYTLSAGTHTLQLRARSINGSTIVFTDNELFYMNLGR